MERMKATFMDLRTDFGFKYLFGNPKHARVLLRFLNALFEGRMVVKDVKFHNKEMLPKNPEGKLTIYDIYCTTSEGHHFIIEMQKADMPNFDKRIIYYTSAAIVEQGRKGINYEISPVYSIVVTDSDLKQFSRRLVNEILLIERQSGEVYSEDLRIIFLSLPRVKEEWSECKGDLEKILYLIKNMHTMDKESKQYKSREYVEMFDAAEICSMAAEDVVEYSKSYAKRLDDQAAIEYATEQARAEGEARGEAKRTFSIAENMLREGASRDFICKVTGLSPEQVDALR